MLIVTSEWNVPSYTKIEFKLWSFDTAIQVDDALLPSGEGLVKNIEHLFYQWAAKHKQHLYTIDHHRGFRCVATCAETPFPPPHTLTPVPPGSAGTTATEANHET